MATTEERAPHGKREIDADELRSAQIDYEFGRSHAQAYADWAGEVALGEIASSMNTTYEELADSHQSRHASPVMELGTVVDPDCLKNQYGKIYVNFWWRHRSLRRTIADTLRLTTAEKRKHVGTVGIHYYADEEGNSYRGSTYWDGGDRGSLAQARLVVDLMLGVKSHPDSTEVDTTDTPINLIINKEKGVGAV